MFLFAALGLAVPAMGWAQTSQDNPPPAASEGQAGAERPGSGAPMGGPPHAPTATGQTSVLLPVAGPRAVPGPGAKPAGDPKDSDLKQQSSPGK